MSASEPGGPQGPSLHDALPILLFFRILRYTGTPTNRAFERIEWVPCADLTAYDFLEADRELVDRMARGEIGFNH